MRSIDTEIRIAATSDRVWGVLTNTSQFPDWNPFITSLDGNLEVGSRLSVTIEPPGGKVMVFKPVVQQVQNQKKLSWLAEQDGISLTRQQLTKLNSHLPEDPAAVSTWLSPRQRAQLKSRP